MGNIFSDLLDSLRSPNQRRRIEVITRMKAEREALLNTRKPGEENLPQWVIRVRRQQEMDFRDDVIGSKD